MLSVPFRARPGWWVQPAITTHVLLTKNKHCTAHCVRGFHRTANRRAVLSFLAVIHRIEARCQNPMRKSKAGQQPKSKQHESKLFYTVKLKRDWNELVPWMPVKAHHFCTNTFRGTNSMNQSSGSLSENWPCAGCPTDLQIDGKQLSKLCNIYLDKSACKPSSWWQSDK